MGLGDTFAFYGYGSDDGTSYGIKLSAKVASAGGFTVQVNPASVKIWPFGAKNLRHVEGVDSDGQRTRLPCCVASNTNYVSGGSFTIGSRTYNVEGQIGEKRKYNHVA
jgi:hypothetical protein